MCKYVHLSNKELIDRFLACIGKTYYYFIGKVPKFASGTVAHIERTGKITDKMLLKLAPVLLSYKEKVFDLAILKDGMEKQGYSMYDLCKHLGNKVYKWEKGIHTPNEDNLNKLESLLFVNFPVRSCSDLELVYELRDRYLALGGDNLN